MKWIPSILCVVCVHVEWSMKKGEEPGKNTNEQKTVCVSLASFKHTLSVYCGTNFFSIWKFIFVKLSILNKIMLFYLRMSVCVRVSFSRTFEMFCSKTYNRIVGSRNELEFRHNMHIRTYKQRWKILKITWGNNKQQVGKSYNRRDTITWFGWFTLVTWSLYRILLAQ